MLIWVAGDASGVPADGEIASAAGADAADADAADAADARSTAARLLATTAASNRALRRTRHGGPAASSAAETPAREVDTVFDTTALIAQPVTPCQTQRHRSLLSVP